MLNRTINKIINKDMRVENKYDDANIYPIIVLGLTVFSIVAYFQL